MNRSTLRSSVRAFLVVAFMAVASAGLLAITWGQPDGAGHPNVGAIVVTPTDGDAFIFCSGTLIAPRAFLTAGHCGVWLQQLLTDGTLTVGQLFVSFDPDNPLAAPAGWLSVSGVDVHPLYGLSPRKDAAFDVAVVTLGADVVGIEPAFLPDAGYLEALRAAGAFKGGVKAHRFTVVGYGSQLDWPPPQIVYGTDRRVAQSGYLALSSGWLFLSQNAAVGNGGTGYGDSGGPTFWYDESLGRDVLVSTTVWGNVNTVATGITQRLDLPEILEFLNEFKQ